MSSFYNLSKESQPILLNICDISTYIGQSQWNTVEKIESLWKKINPISFNKALSFMKKLHMSTESLEKTSDQILEKELGTTTINQIKQSNKIDYVSKITDLHLDFNKTKKLIETAKSLENRCYGIKKESSALDIFEKTYNVKLFRSPPLVRKNINKISFFGKIDALYKINNTNIIIEIKNRIKGFFNELRNYEKTQIQLYMWMNDVKLAKLVECFNGEINVINLEYDKDYVESVHKKLFTFLDNLYDFINNGDLESYVLLDDDTKKQFILNNIIKIS